MKLIEALQILEGYGLEVGGIRKTSVKRASIRGRLNASKGTGKRRRRRITRVLWDRIHSIRKESDFSHVIIAKKVGVSNATVGRVLSKHVKRPSE